MEFGEVCEVGEIAEKIAEIMERKINDREPPDRIWLTDTVYCGRKKIFEMSGLKRRFSGKAVSRIWLGIIVGEALKELGIAGEVPVEYRGVRGKVDVILETGEPVEVKVATNLYVTASEYSKSHVEQLSRYCLALNKETGILLYYIAGLEVESLPVRRYRFNLDQVKRVTDERIDALSRAVEAKDPFTLPATWHSNSLSNWECRDCSYLAYCRVGRWQSLSTYCI